jgi:hypothetical protein
LGLAGSVVEALGARDIGAARLAHETLGRLLAADVGVAAPVVDLAERRAADRREAPEKQHPPPRAPVEQLDLPLDAPAGAGARSGPGLARTQPAGVEDEEEAAS